MKLEVVALDFPAGTQTKASVLYLQKGRTERPVSVFMGISRDLGFQVASRKGVQIKVPQGENDLPAILTTYRDGFSLQNGEAARVLRTDPSCVVVPESAVLKGSWTPNHYSAGRFETVATIAKDDDFDLVPLHHLVEFHSDSRKPEPWREGWAFVSVLHILGEGVVDFRGALNYSPKTPGVPTAPGELLVSRINPRIPRVCITPNFGVRTLCSSEFEVMTVSLDSYTLAYLLQTEVVQKQIRSLTSGTSASHNRIRTSELAQVLVPIPKPKTKKARLISTLAADYRLALESLSKSAEKLAKIRRQDGEVFCI